MPQKRYGIIRGVLEGKTAERDSHIKVEKGNDTLTIKGKKHILYLNEM